MYKIDIYLIENNITTTKLCATRILLSKDTIIQTISIEEVENLRKEDS